jgi:nucleotide-binding universal stress UspA family protein
MPDTTTILVPTDGSPCADRACTYATHLADALGAQIHVVHVAPADEQPGSDWLRDVAISEADVCDDLFALAAAPEETPDAEAVAHRTAYHDDPADGILRYAREHDVDLIVMGTHGRAGAARLVLGSVAESVLRAAPCPVVTLRVRNEGSAAAST